MPTPVGLDSLSYVFVFETGGPSGSGGGSKVSDVAAYSADGCLIRVYFETAFSSARAWSIWSYA